MITRSLTSSVKHVWSKDGALDRASPAFDLAAYHRDGDMAHLPCLPGCAPTVFTLARLPRRTFVYCADLDGFRRVCEAVAYGVREVAGFVVDGQELSLAHQKSDLGQRLTEASMDALFDPDLFGELAGRVLELSQIDPTRGQG